MKHDLPADAAARIQALEAQLAATQALLNQTLAHVPFAIAIVDTDMRYLEVNANWMTAYQLGEQSLTGRSHYEVFPEIGDDWKQIHQHCLQGATNTTERAPFPRADGRLDWLRWKVCPWYQPDGRIGGLLMITEVITEQVNATRKTKESQSLLFNVLENIPLSVFWVDRQFRYLGSNQRFADELGVASSADLIGKTALDYYSNQAQIERYFATDSEIMSSGVERLNAEEEHELPDGRWAWMRTSKVPLRNEANEIIGLLGLAEDITEWKQIQLEQAQFQIQLLEAQRRALAELSTPIIPIFDGILIMPIIGVIDTWRARDILRELLTAISQRHARVVIIDITGVPILDSGVAGHLTKTIQAAKLKGCQTIITGVTDGVAETIIELGIQWSGIETRRDLQGGLMSAFRWLGATISAPH